MTLSVDEALQQGVVAHKEGKVQEAERLYRAILQSQPLHPDANHNLGVIAVSVNKPDAALPLFKTALEANPKIEQFWLSYIDALLKEKQFENAKQAFEQAKQQGLAGKKFDALRAQLPPIPQTENANSASPSQSELNSLLEHYQNGRFGDAEKLALSITHEFPEHPFGWKVLGGLFGQSGRNFEAINANQIAVALSPQDAEAHSNLGVTLQKLGRLEEAEASYTQAIALKPDFAEAHNNLGTTLKELGRLDESEASYTQAIALKPDHAEAHNNLGNTLKELGRLDEAEASYRQAIELKPDYTNAYFNLGKVYRTIGKHSKAVKCFEKTLELSSEDSLGATLQLARLGKKEIPDKTPERYMQEFYRSKSKYWSNNDKRQNKYRGHLLIENAFKKTHDSSEQVDILDLGCGTGSLARFLRPYARTLVGVDLSPDMLFKAEEIGLYDSLYKKDLSQYLGEISKHYDTVVAAAVLIHFFDLDDIFCLVRDSLKINGRFIFSVFEETKKNKDLNSFLMYSHSDDYVTALADRLNLKISYKQKDVHEYYKDTPVRAIIYVLKKIS